MIILTPEQAEALELVIEGKSICLSGPGGTGKSTIVKEIISKLSLSTCLEGSNEYNKDDGMRRHIAVTAMTGIAGTYINGITLHSWAGIPVRQMAKAQILKSIMSGINKVKTKTVGNESEEALIIKRWIETDLLIVDEVSMMSAEIFNKLDYLGRNIRENDKPFGGLQLVLSGDFCQLPPIGTNERYCFESQIWNQVITKTFLLKQIMRQSDPKLQTVLNEVRDGIISLKSKEYLNSRLLNNLSEEDAAKIDDQARIRPTLIYPHKEKVNDINRSKFEELVINSVDNSDQIHSYLFTDSMVLKPSFRGKIRPDIRERELEEFLDQHCSAEKELHLCLGCQVMLTVNLDIEAGLVNGLTGIITSFQDGLPVMSYQCMNTSMKKTIKIDKWTWSPDHPRYIVKRTQIPLILAWAITVHRSQGATLSLVQADLREAFGPGMAYVILSRIKSLSGLYLEGINYSKIKCDSRVLAFYKGLLNKKNI